LDGILVGDGTILIASIQEAFMILSVTLGLQAAGDGILAGDGDLNGAAETGAADGIRIMPTGQDTIKAFTMAAMTFALAETDYTLA
jgi:hypothetical protein